MAINKWKLHTFLQQRDFQKASTDGLGNRFWIDTRLLSVKVKSPDPGVASHDQKPDRGIVSGIKSPPLARTPPLHGIYIDRSIRCCFGVSTRWSIDVQLPLCSLSLWSGGELRSREVIVIYGRKSIWVFDIIQSMSSVENWNSLAYHTSYIPIIGRPGLSTCVNSPG